MEFQQKICVGYVLKSSVVRTLVSSRYSENSSWPHTWLNTILHTHTHPHTLALFQKFKKWSKDLASVFKRWVYDDVKFGFHLRFPWGAITKTCSLVFFSAICPLDVIYKAICIPKFGFHLRFPWGAITKTCSLVFFSAICPLDVIYKAICIPKKLMSNFWITEATDDQSCSKWHKLLQNFKTKNWSILIKSTVAQGCS